jgi:hypothetical protein
VPFVNRSELSGPTFDFPSKHGTGLVDGVHERGPINALKHGPSVTLVRAKASNAAIISVNGRRGSSKP